MYNYIAIGGNLFAVITSFFIAVFVFFKNAKPRTNKWFIIINFCIGFWCLGALVINVIPNSNFSLNFHRFCYFFGIFIPMVSINFAAATHKIEVNRIIKVIFYPITFLLLITIPTPLFIKSLVTVKGISLLQSSPGPFYYLFFLTLFLGCGLCVYLLFKGIKSFSGVRKNQLKFAFIGYSLVYFSGFIYFATIFRILNIFTPAGYIVSVGISVLFYAIIKHQLMDIRIAVTRVGIFSFIYAFVLGIPFLLATVWKTQFINLFGDSWIIAFTFITILFASGGLLIYNLIRTKVEKILKAKYSNILIKADELKKYVPKSVGESILNKEGITNKRTKITVLFTDLEGFTELTDNIEAEEISKILNEYLDEMTCIAHKHGGIVDKFIGDAIMVFFGGADCRDHKADAVNCVKMAVEMQEKMKKLGKKWYNEGIQNTLRMRVGINTGISIVGNFGSKARLSYTAIGNGVNIASRLEKECAPGKILISHATWAYVKDEVSIREQEEINVKGIKRKIKVYEVSL